MGREDIMVNGMMIDEYLKDKELISEEEERKRLLRENTPDAHPYRKSRIRYKSKKEKNGKVKTLNQNEMNKAMRIDKLIRSLRNNNYGQFVVSELVCGDNNFLNNANLRDLVETISKEHSISIIKHPIIPLRKTLNSITKSELKRVVSFKPSAGGKIINYKLRPQVYRNIIFNVAWELFSTPLNEGGKKIDEVITALNNGEIDFTPVEPEPIDLNQNSTTESEIKIKPHIYSEVEVEPEPEPEPETEPETEPRLIEQEHNSIRSSAESIEDIIASVIGRIKGVKSIRSLAKFDGDLNINIYINKVNDD